MKAEYKIVVDINHEDFENQLNLAAGQWFEIDRFSAVPGGDNECAIMYVAVMVRRALSRRTLRPRP